LVLIIRKDVVPNIWLPHLYFVYSGILIIKTIKVMTSQMQESNYNELMINDIINKLRIIKVDGETMQYILEKVGMEDQMLRQLVMSQPIGEVNYMYEERKQLEEFNKK
jgi:hypothetical protein